MSDLAKLQSAADIEECDLLDNIELLKATRDEYEEITLIDTAKFFTDKLVTLTKEEDKNEIYRLAKLLHEKEEFQRAAFVITKRNLQCRDLSCRYLAAKCFFDCKEFDKALEILSNENQDSITYDVKGGTLSEWKSSIELLKGYTHEAMNNRDLAKGCFLEALRLNIFCYEAFHAFTRFDMISKDDEKELFTFLDFDKEKFTFSADHFIKYFYLNEMNKSGEYDNIMNQMDLVMKSNSNIEDLSLFANIPALSIDVQLNAAEKLYNDCEFNKCYKMVSDVYFKDLYNTRCLLLNIGCLMELNKGIVLQDLSHKLVEIYPESPISWYSVGCYYYLSSNPDTARKYFSKATTMDTTFQPAMIMYGHSFEMESLHDQAMAVYLDLSKKMPSSFLPPLYVGVEYSHMNNPIMAQRYINEALILSPNNLFVLHEFGIVSYQKKEYDLALRHFLAVYDLLSKKHLMPVFPEKWEPLLNNMGHVCRKLGKYDQAISFHNQALRMVPQNASTYDAVGLVYSLKGELQMACDSFQKALSLKRDDAFAMTMYNIVYQEMIDKDIKETLAED